MVREEEIFEGLERERNRPVWSLVDYFDVVGNEENGWEVNNLAVVEEEIYLDEEISEAELLKFLKRIGWMKKHVRLNMVEFEWSDGIVEISERKSSRPLGRLEREEKR